MPKSEDISKDIREVLDYKTTDKPVVTVYLTVDNARTQKKDYITKLNSMITESRKAAEEDQSIPKSDKKMINSLFAEIKEYVSESFSANSTKTLLIYTKAEHIWKIFRLPVVMRPKIVIDPKPHTQNLRNLINNTKRYAVLMIDREKAQIASIYLGQLSDYLAAFISDVPSKVNFRSEAAMREKKILGRIEEKLHQFFKYIDEETLKLFRDKRFDELILAGRNELLSQFKNYMHSYLQERYIGDVILEPSSPAQKIEEKANALIQEKQEEYKNDLVDNLIDEHNPNRWGVLGIEAVINSLLNDQIKILIYERDFKREGYVCVKCRYMTVEKKESCPYCDAKLRHYSDIVDEIIEQALGQGCEIVDVSGNQRLKDAGSIGAILRYRL